MINDFKNIEIEQTLIACLLQNPYPVNLSPEDFAEPYHGQVFSEIISGKQMKDYIGTEDYDYLHGLLPLIVTTIPSQLEEYASMIRELSQKRYLSAVLNGALVGMHQKSFSELSAALISDLQDSVEPRGIKSAKEVRKEIMDSIELPKECYSTGVHCLDVGMAGGLYEGFTYGLCGAEKMGKTTLAHTISYNLNIPHLYIAMEMGARQIEERNVARELGENSLKFLSRKIEKNRVETARMNENLYYADAPGWSLDDIIQSVSSARVKHGIKGFIVDYWQLITQDNSWSEERHLRKCAQDLSNFARKNKMFCIILAQMNKDGHLFGGNGLRKACDQLYMINPCDMPNGSDRYRWLGQDATRYTEKQDIGAEDSPALFLETNSGPYFRCMKS